MLHGSPAFALAAFAAAQGADLMVLGSPARGLAGGGEPRGVSQGLKAMAPCSLLVARQPPGSAVWAATDGSRPARQALAAAYGVARALSLPLTVVHAREPTPGPAPTPVAPTPVPAAAARLLTGPAARVVLEAAAYAPDVLLAVGRRGRTGGVLHTFGTVSDQVLARAPCSVLAVQPTA